LPGVAEYHPAGAEIAGANVVEGARYARKLTGATRDVHRIIKDGTEPSFVHWYASD
jgi:hypothetical protein